MYYWSEVLIIVWLNVVLAVAKALRKVTEGKASAQAEAAEWKRKYELAREHNLQLEQKGYLRSAYSLVFFISPLIYGLT